MRRYEHGAGDGRLCSKMRGDGGTEAPSEEVPLLNPAFLECMP
jgi:hypothetical protein